MTWLLRGLALVLAIGAIIAALIGYRLSNQPPPPPAPPAPTESVVQAAKPLKAGQPIGAEDIALASVTTKSAGSFTGAAQVVGQAPLLDVAVGETLTRAHFPTPGQLARGLREGERAVAIKVDEVVGLGGFAQPGDLVDVLFYLRGSTETGSKSSAQVVLAGVRLLAFGDAVRQPAGDGEAPAPTTRAAEKVSGRAKTTTSAVIAVPEDMAPRLMLAANSGNLRLSLRPTEAAAPAPAPTAPATAKAPAAPAADPHLIHLAELAQAKPADKKAAKGRGAAAPGVVMHEGETVRSLGAPR